MQNPAIPAAPLILYSPLTGPVCPLEQVPDPVFAGRMLGDGIAIDPIDNHLTAPCSGRVTQLARTHHALTITTAEGAEILLHLGIETVHLNGQGIESKVKQGDWVSPGQVLIEFDADYVARHAKSLLSVMLVANGDRFEMVQRNAVLAVTPQTPVFTLRERRDQTSRTSLTDNAAVAELSRPVVVKLAGGLHARPAARVRETARRFTSSLEIAYGDKRADCNSVTALLGLGVDEGMQVVVYAKGADAEAALGAVIQTLQTHIAAEALSPPVMSTIKAQSTVDPGVITGICASPGLAMGVLVHWDTRSEQDLTMENDEALPSHQPELEAKRLEAALAAVTATLNQRVSKARQRGAEAEAGIFTAHIALLDDPQLIAQAQLSIVQGNSAARAWRAAVQAQCEILSALADTRLAARVVDLHDLELQVLRTLAGKSSKPALVLPEHAVLLAEEFSPSDLESLDRERVKALCMLGGGPTSHAAIIARSYGIPALVALGRDAALLPQGQHVIVDAQAGRLETQPDVERIASVAAQLAQQAIAENYAKQRATEPAITLDGLRIEVAANVANVAEARLATEHGADGVGLLRTEFLFLGRDQAPSEEEQVATYQAVVDTLQGRPVLIRTVDIGGDKPIPYLPFPYEPNPALGLRGIRIADIHPDIVMAQWRALLQISPLSACRILLPMVGDAQDLVQQRTRIETLAQSLGLTQKVSIGAMIEVPSAALLAGVLAEYVDFLSIGTNDLTQYTLAMDRGNAALAGCVDGLHPAVLQLIQLTVAGAKLHNRPVAVCGALASDPEAVPVLIGLGVNELSVEPAQVANIKALVRKLDYAQCEHEAKTLLDLASAPAVRAHCRRVWAA